jgi:hypothetical protein
MHDRAVELVQVGELVEVERDLGVFHPGVYCTRPWRTPG